MACRTCEYCGAVTTERRRQRCHECLLLVCDKCYHEEGRCCNACFTMARRMVEIVSRERD